MIATRQTALEGVCDIRCYGRYCLRLLEFDGLVADCAAGIGRDLPGGDVVPPCRFLRIAINRYPRLGTVSTYWGIRVIVQCLSYPVHRFVQRLIEVDKRSFPQICSCSSSRVMISPGRRPASPKLGTADPAGGSAHHAYATPLRRGPARTLRNGSCQASAHTCAGYSTSKSVR